MIYFLVVLAAFSIAAYVKWFLIDEGRAWDQHVDFLFMRGPSFSLFSNQGKLEISVKGNDIPHSERCQLALNMLGDRHAKRAFWLSAYLFEVIVPSALIGVVLQICFG